MTIKNLLSVTAIGVLVLGLAWILFPARMLQAWGAAPVPIANYMSRRYAVMFFGYAFIMWKTRNAQPSDAKRAIVGGGFVTSLCMAAMSSYRLISHSINAFGWFPLAAESLLTVGFGYFRFYKQEPAA